MALLNPRADRVEALSAHGERTVTDRARDLDAAARKGLYLEHFTAISSYAFFPRCRFPRPRTPRSRGLAPGGARRRSGQAA